MPVVVRFTTILPTIRYYFEFAVYDDQSVDFVDAGLPLLLAARWVAPMRGRYAVW